MKKILVGALALTMLCGCGSKKPSQKVCSGNVEGQDVAVTLKFDENEVLTDVVMDMNVDAGSVEVANLMKTTIETQKAMILANFGENAEGDVEVKVDGTIIYLKVTVDVTKMTEIADVEISASKEEMIKDLEELGLTCK